MLNSMLQHVGIWTLWKLINIKFNKKIMDVECNIMLWHTQRHVFKMLKFRISKTSCNPKV
jgi:hypothetical protein